MNDDAAQNVDGPEEDLPEPSPRTRRTLDAVRNVYPHNIEHIERQFGNLILEDFLIFASQLHLLSNRDRAAVLYLLVEESRGAMATLSSALPYLQARNSS
jgi:hypothetical protein